MSRVSTHVATTELHDLIHDRLPSARRDELIAHLDRCPECQSALDALCDAPDCLRRGGLQESIPPHDSAFWQAMDSLEAELDSSTPLPGSLTAAEPAPPAATDDDALSFLDPPEEPGTLGKLGYFSIVEVVGRGGMGIVFKALDQCLERHVAIKVLDPQFARNDTARQRFCREARAAAAITHENVVAVHQVDIDEKSNLPYLVMQYVPGETLEDRLDRAGPLQLVEILRIGKQTAAGLAAAHAHGLIHRDVKPANILLEQGNDKVRLTDFGLARAVEDVKLTQTGLVAGTPLYMAPEQAQGEKIDHRTDLFSLGSVLYAMCTGNPPFAGSTPFVVLKSVTEEIPQPVRDINPAVPDWLEEIIARLHAKKPDDRWQSAAELARLFSHKLAELHVTAPDQRTPTIPLRPVSRPRSSRWLRAWAGIGQGLTALLVLLTISELAGWTHVVRRPGEPAPVEHTRSPQFITSFNAQVGPIWSTAFSPDGKTLLMGIDDGTILIWDIEADRIRATLTAHKGPVWSVAYTAKGDRFASSSDDGTAKVWDAASNGDRLTIPHESGVRALVFSPDGNRLVTGTRNGKILVWDAGTGQQLLKMAKGHDGTVMALAYAKDGRTIASASGDKTVKLWDAAKGHEQVTLSGHNGGVYSVAFSPDSKTVASGSWDKTVRLWDANTGNRLRILYGHKEDVWSVAFAPDGSTVASGSDDHTVKLWDTATGAELTTLRGHTSTIYTVAYSPNSDLVASGGREGIVFLWHGRR
jgi:serine/threonine protein kinase